MKFEEAPAMGIEPSKMYTARFETDQGEILCQLHADKAPNTVNNFVFLAREGFYDEVTFHRVIKDFMAQSGDPTGTGTGGPGYTFADEFHPDLRHDVAGILSMANAGPNTNGSQFFFSHVPTPWLDNKHSVFGKITEGLDVLLSIAERDPGNPGAPATRINRIEILETDPS